MKKVGLIMGSDSDLPVVKKASQVLDELGITYEAHVYSAHRTPAEARAWSLNAREEGFGVIIAFAGMAAHLAGAIAANTTLPVIGVPCRSAAFDGMDALLSTVMMPGGIPVATVAVDGGKMPHCSQRRSWQSPTKNWPGLWMRGDLPRQRQFLKKTQE